MRRACVAWIAVWCATALGSLHSALAQSQAYSPEDLARRTIERRAVEAAIWGMPLVNTDAMRQAYFRDVGAKYNDICYFSKPQNWKFQVTTPNASTNYVYFNYNLKDGPVVVEIPAAVDAGLLGSMVDAWDEPMADIGPAGADQGKGGKYLLLPPDFKGETPPGYFALRYPTYNGYALYRAIRNGTTDADAAAALALVKKLRVYPLAQVANPPEQRFIDIYGKTFDGIANFDESFFESLNRMVQEEPVLPRDVTIMGMLKSIGIEKGKDFKPDAATQSILKSAAQEAQAHFIDLLTSYSQPWWPDRNWSPPDPKGVKTGFTYLIGDALDVDARGYANFAAFALPKKTGTSLVYLFTFRDSRGERLSGERTYTVHIPANVPAKQYWSMIVYAVDTAALIREAPVVTLDSYNQAMKRNADGSVDIYFGPKAPAGKEANWIYTAPGKAFFPAMRFYDPDKPLFDKTWKLPDIERVTTSISVQSQLPSAARNAIAVTPDNFNRAETDMIFAESAKTPGLGRFLHYREPMSIDFHVVRPNRDTLYSLSVFDLDAGPVTITLLNGGQRFISMQEIDEDHYTPEVIYGAGTYIFTREKIGTRYVSLGVRILVDPADPQDIKQVHTLQDAIMVTQPGGPGRFEVPNWDQASQKKVRDALLALAQTLPDTKRTFGARHQVDPVRHLIGTAFAFGGNPEKDALYLNVTPSKNDDTTVHRLTVKDVPVDAFWSISVYNAEGHFQKNAFDAYTLNNTTAKRNPDGSVAVQFGGCDGKIVNCLPTMPGWNYMVRLYRPRAEILNGTWKFPEMQPVDAGSRALQ